MNIDALKKWDLEWFLKVVEDNWEGSKEELEKIQSQLINIWEVN